MDIEKDANKDRINLAVSNESDTVSDSKQNSDELLFKDSDIDIKDGTEIYSKETISTTALLGDIRDKTGKALVEDKDCYVNVIDSQPSQNCSYDASLLTCLQDGGQFVINKENLRSNVVINPSALQRYGVVNELRRTMFIVERQPSASTEMMFYKFFTKDKEEVLEVYSPGYRSCFLCNAHWNWCNLCDFKSMVYCPPGMLAGFISRKSTFFVQEFHILDPDENLILRLLGGPMDLVIFSPDLTHELGRLSVHGWHGIMHEIRRSSKDVGITFPVDMEVRLKAVLLGAALTIDWLYASKGGKIEL